MLFRRQGTFVGLAMLGVMAWTTLDAWGRAYVRNNPEEVPRFETALVLGTAPFGVRGQNLRTLTYRLDAAAALWHSGRVKRLLASGNRIDDSYDETAAMRDGLLARGVPASVIELDPLGRRTWDSIRRARDIFGQRRLLVVSQRDHLARSVFLARHLGIEAWGVAAGDDGPNGFYEAVFRRIRALVAFGDALFGAR